MKKWLLSFALVCLIIVGSTFLIPIQKRISYTVPLKCTSPAALRLLLSSDRSKWWPGEITGSDSYEYKGFSYRISGMLLNGFKGAVINKTDTLHGSLVVLDESDSSKFVWSSDVHFSKNPISRVLQYIKLAKFKDNISNCLTVLKAYFDNEKNLYGGKINLQKIQETPLVATNKEFTYYPSVPEIYTVIASLKKYISDNKEKEMNYPMMNVHTDDSVTYNLMVAIQTEHEMQSSGIFDLKRLMMGKMLTMDVQGGPGNVRNSQVQLRNYLNDHNMVSPAIPYQLLITDRMKEADTSRWVTRLYYPVF